MTTQTCSPNQLQAAVAAWLVENDMESGIIFHSGAEWRARGESRGAGASLTLVIDHLRLSSLLNFEWAGWDGSAPEDERLYDEWLRLLERHGYSHEIGYRWTCHFYPMEA